MSSFEMTMPYQRPSDAQASDMETTFRLSQFLYAEAQAIDERRFDDWLAMLAEDLHYEAPARYNRLPRERTKEWASEDEAKHFEDTKEYMQLRVKRLQTDKSWSEDPPSRTRHLITNVQVAHSVSANAYIVDSNFSVYRARAADDEEFFFGTRHDHIRENSSAPAGFEIARRTILFDQTLILSANLGIFF
ncbi:aromatic-ring-hydroxylating dioxygenase subunit beta [Aurantiacibacter sediminis]|uniref:3-phenylpropionate/cinnamic acid dioxygenase subunit beta n=1 Tax=Aurantiacibacter sediminis TaxID=2793064 RepID=A0ABS0N6M5_9SPHN|nr:3-phenylpropionate/cinnamic acid dioxygenase subunit beta [Aurantiacibacter sediminis]MBH5323482.1 3-phenylpropionate/cinnamic acid dioxygenase subunit beta [Aurantiacibacter sediminis]